MTVSPVLVNGSWRAAHGVGTFTAFNPMTGLALSDQYPICNWADLDEALDAARAAADQIDIDRQADQVADFLETYARFIEDHAADLVQTAHRETGLPSEPRLATIELPRTTSQLRQAASATREMSWRRPVIDTRLNIRSCFAPIGPVCVFGPNNFPFAFGSVSGGDFAAAIAAGCPVIGKAHPAHPGTTRLFAELAHRALSEVGLPAAMVQMVFHMPGELGLRLVADSRLGATAFTGSRKAGLALKDAADRAGNLIYLEMSSLNPVVVLEGALAEHGDAIADEFITSCLMACGQFCTKPGLLMLVKGDPLQPFLDRIRHGFGSAAPGVLLTSGVASAMESGLDTLCAAGAAKIAESPRAASDGFAARNVLLQVSAHRFLEKPDALQTEVFGSASLVVVADDLDELRDVIASLHGNLTGCVYSASSGADDATYDTIAHLLRSRVGRLLNDKMPTGVAVSHAMNHGGPYPSTSHPGFTAVGMPASIQRFASLQCFDSVRPHRLPRCLADRNPTGHMWRLVDGQYTCGDVSPVSS